MWQYPQNPNNKLTQSKVFLAANTLKEARQERHFTKKKMYL